MFSREHEHRLKYLKEALNGSSSFDDPDLQAEYEELSRRQELFLEEGAQRLNGGLGTQDSMISKISKGVFFYTSLAYHAVPAFLTKATNGTLVDRHHWDWITDELILGGIPLLSPIPGFNNHLEMIRSQIQGKGRKLSMVVACLLDEELEGFNVGINFARRNDWAKYFGSIDYVQLPVEDTTANFSSHEFVRQALTQLNHCLRTKNSVAYIHCKAGVGRSWTVLMCYLCTFSRKSFENARQLIKMHRFQVNPSQAQIQFVKDHIEKYS